MKRLISICKTISWVRTWRIWIVNLWQNQSGQCLLNVPENQRMFWSFPSNSKTDNSKKSWSGRWKHFRGRHCWSRPPNVPGGFITDISFLYSQKLSMVIFIYLCCTSASLHITNNAAVSLGHKDGCQMSTSTSSVANISKTRKLFISGVIS